MLVRVFTRMGVVAQGNTRLVEGDHGQVGQRMLDECRVDYGTDRGDGYLSTQQTVLTTVHFNTVYDTLYCV